MRAPILPRWLSWAAGAVLAVAQLVAVVVLLGRWWGWSGLVLGPLVLGAVWLSWPLPVEDDEGCVRCEHASIHHRGCCQGCLRDVANGRELAIVPCGRFRRWTPRSRWARVRRATPG